MAALERRFQAMASACELQLEGDDATLLQQAAGAAEAEVRRIEAAYSRYRADSVVSRLNAAAGSGRWTALDDETSALLDFAGRLHDDSGGLFDITSGVLRRAWDFRTARVPGDAELQALLPLIGWPQVQRGPQGARLPRAGMEIDFGGIGKEYAADRAAAVLARLGLRHGLVNLGGDLRVLGPHADGSPWRIGIQHPRQEDAVIATVELSQGALATSGDYERFFERDGARHCHILDPRSGRSVCHWQSVSVAAPLAVAAGALATIAMLLQGDALAFLQAQGASALAVDAQGSLQRLGL
ncbi:MAG: FAD:protein FMN transferase [Rubrivivax sp.]